MEEIELDVLTIDDKEYIVIDEINDNENTYCYLCNDLNDEEFFIKKIKENQLLPIDSEEEFNKALKLFKDKHMDELI